MNRKTARLLCAENRDDITSLYFDGKKTATRIMTTSEKTGKWSPTVVIQDHYVVQDEPGSQYITHVTPKSGHGNVIARSIFDFLNEESLLTKPMSILAAGTDGTNVNVGCENGAIHYLEMMTGQPLHYFICQLHGNELPFRAVFYHYDGKPDGPKKFTGPIGKQIQEHLSSSSPTNFQKISFDDFPSIPNDIVEDLS